MGWKARGETKGSARMMRMAAMPACIRGMRASRCYDRATRAFNALMASGYRNQRAGARWEAWTTMAHLYGG